MTIGTEEELAGIPAEQAEVAPRKKKRGSKWRTQSKKRRGKEVECPSGERCLIRILDIQDIINAGLLGDLDLFSKKLFPKKLDEAGRPVEDEQTDEDEDSIWAILADDEKREFFFSLMEKLIVLGVVDPVVKFSTDVVGDDEISCEWIELNDRLFLFNTLMEPINKIATFRTGQATGVETVATSEVL
jgi:hypothetical protein